ncbi:MAG: hypothetical protein R3F55_00215 [Alphaproteobacteria bacterium]
MTVSTTLSRVIYAGDGVTTDFAVPFAFLDATDLAVSAHAADGTATALSLATDYTVDGGQGAPGTVHALAAPAAGVDWVIHRRTARSQETDYTANDPFPAESHERALDRLTMIAQELDEAMGRAATLPVSSPLAALELPGPAAGALIGWNGAGDGLHNVLAADVGLVPVTAFAATLLDDVDRTAAQATLGLVPGSDVLAPDGDGSQLSGIVTDNPPNLLLNGDFAVAQQGTAFTAATTPANADATYGFDQWILLSDGDGAVELGRATAADGLAGVATGLLIDLTTAARRAGVCQIVEAREAAPALGARVSLSFLARKKAANVAVDTLRAVIASWTGTADSVTRDIVAAWNGEGGAPTLAAGWTLEGTATFALSDAFAACALEDVAIDAVGASNIAVLLMIENGDAALDDLLYLSAVNLVASPTARPFVPRPYDTQLRLCQRHFERIGAVASGRYCAGFCDSSTVALGVLPFQRKRTVPSLSVSSASGFLVRHRGVTNTNSTNVSFALNDFDRTQMAITVAAGLTAGDACFLSSGLSAATHINVDARL